MDIDEALLSLKPAILVNGNGELGRVVHVANPNLPFETSDSGNDVNVLPSTQKP